MYHQVYCEECREDEPGDERRNRGELNKSRLETTVNAARKPHLNPRSEERASSCKSLLATDGQSYNQTVVVRMTLTTNGVN